MLAVFSDISQGCCGNLHANPSKNKSCDIMQRIHHGVSRHVMQTHDVG